MSDIQFQTNRTFDLLGVGRIAVDFNANEINRPMEETISFTKYVGGSPANITIGSARLGMKTGFIGKVSDDQMGRFVVNYLNKNNIDTTYVTYDQTGAVTGLAFTEIKSPTDCSILMYRDNVADLLLETNDISEDYIKQSKVLLISGTALSKSPSREAVFLAIEYAIKHDVVVVFDLDYRPYSWTNDKETATYYNLAAEKSHIIIGTREEFDMMEQFEESKQQDKETAQKWFDHKAGIVIIKHGKEGSIAYTKSGKVITSETFETEVLKTFGAGDSYASAFIYGLMQGWSVEKAMEYGSGSAAIVISKHSCSEAMPTFKELDEFVNTANKVSN